MTGASSTAAVARKLKTINPATEQVLKEYEIFTKEQLDKLVKQARQTFLEWKNNIDRRAEFLYSFAKELQEEQRQSGQNCYTGDGESDKGSQIRNKEICPWTIEYYADHGKIFTTGKVFNTDIEKKFY